MKPRAIANRLGVDRESLRDVKKAVKRLIRSGKLVYGPDHLVELPAPEDMNRISGTFKANARWIRLRAAAGAGEQRS